MEAFTLRARALDITATPPLAFARTAALLARIGDPSARPDFLTVLALGYSAQGDRVTVVDAARACFLSRRALVRRLTRAGYPPVSTILRWGALIRAMEAYAPLAGRRGKRALYRAAAVSGFRGDPYVVSNVMRRLSGLRPRAWAEDGADMEALALALVARWRGCPEEEASAAA